MSVDAVAELAAFGRTLESARIDLVGQLSRHLGVYTGNIPVVATVELSAPTEKTLTAARAARNTALEAAATSLTATATAVLELTEEGLSLRDCGYLLGLSHGRVRQILDTVDTRRRVRGARAEREPRRRKTATKTGDRS